MMNRIGFLLALALSCTTVHCAAASPTIYLAGDSTCAVKKEEARPECGWGEKFQHYFKDGAVLVDDRALNGRSTKSFRDEGHWDAILGTLRKRDYVLIQFGHNDEKFKSPERYSSPEDYCRNLCEFVREVREKGATPILLTPISRRHYEGDVPVRSHGEYPDAMKRAVAETGCGLIDMEQITFDWLGTMTDAQSGAFFVTKDRTHLNYDGAEVVAGMVAAHLSEVCEPLAKLLKKPIGAPEYEVLEEERRDGYSCRLIEYDGFGGGRLQAYLLVPDKIGKKAKAPGLVLLHDHGARFDIGKEKLVRPLASAPENIKRSAKQWNDDNFDGSWFGDSLARRGFVVIVPDMLYWGSRSTELCQRWSRMKFCGEQGDIKAVKNEVYEGQRAVFDSLQRLNVVWAEQTLREDERAAELLGSLPFVDSHRIGAFGWSMGAHRCWMLAGFSRLVKSGVALCWMTLKETCSVPPSASDYSMMVPELREKYDFPDIARKLQPKRFLFLNGKQDKLFSLCASEEAFARMQAIYSESCACGQLDTEFFDGPHHCGLDVQRRITDWLVKDLEP